MSIILDEQPADFKPIIDSSTFRSYKAYVDVGFEKEVPRLQIGAQHDREMKFITEVDISKGPIKRTITRMIRIKRNGKEYFWFTENWYAKNWKNVDITNPVTDRIEGIVFLPDIQPAINEKGQKIGKKLNPVPKTEYEFEFSKAAIDKWIEDTGTDRESIKFTVIGTKRNDDCENYDQFVNNNWIEANNIMMQDGSFELNYVEGLKKKDSSQQNKK